MEKLNEFIKNLHTKEGYQMEILKIVQWGKERSIVYSNNTQTGEVKFLMINNDYLLMLDEMGLIE